jgi:hypothetical protein
MEIEERNSINQSEEEVAYLRNPDRKLNLKSNRKSNSSSVEKSFSPSNV